MKAGPGRKETRAKRFVIMTIKRSGAGFQQIKEA